MLIKQSLEENKQEILDSLPTEELKKSFLKSLDKIEEPKSATVEELVTEAQAPDFVPEDMYEGIKKEIEDYRPPAPMSADAEKAAIEEALKNPPKAEG